MNKRIARIESTFLGWEDHGCFTCSLNVDYGGSRQGVGGYVLDRPGVEGRQGSVYGTEFLLRTMRACGVDRWEKLPGRTVYVLTDVESMSAKVLGLEPLPTEPGERFLFSEIEHLADR